MFVDVHCHLDICKDIHGVVERAEKAGVSVIVTNGINSDTNKKALELSKKYDCVKAALGLYPIDALIMSEQAIRREISFILSHSDEIVAVGEIGMDFKENDDKIKQERIFRQMINCAFDIDKPVIVHSRKAEEECINILEELKAKKVIMHCFSGKKKLVERIIKNGWYLSIPANVKHSEQFQMIVKLAPTVLLLAETDSPFLHPDREKENEPMNVMESYKKIAEIKGISIKEAEFALEENYNKIFG